MRVVILGKSGTKLAASLYKRTGNITALPAVAVNLLDRSNNQ
jgi:hypothetical protein